MKCQFLHLICLHHFGFYEQISCKKLTFHTSMKRRKRTLLIKTIFDQFFPLLLSRVLAPILQNTVHHHVTYVYGYGCSGLMRSVRGVCGTVVSYNAIYSQLRTNINCSDKYELFFCLDIGRYHIKQKQAQLYSVPIYRHAIINHILSIPFHCHQFSLDVDITEGARAWSIRQDLPKSTERCLTENGTTARTLFLQRISSVNMKFGICVYVLTNYIL